MNFKIVSIFRSDHSRHLEEWEMRLAKAAVATFGSFTPIVGKDAEIINVHVVKVEEKDQLAAMKLYKETHQGAEILVCEWLQPERVAIL